MKTRKDMRLKRKKRIAAVIRGTADRPRVSVFRSNTSIEVQCIDDTKRATLLSKRVKGRSIEVAKQLGTSLASLAKTKKITKVVFDRGGFRYHGAVKALADAMREGGLSL